MLEENVPKVNIRKNKIKNPSIIGKNFPTLLNPIDNPFLMQIKTDLY